MKTKFFYSMILVTGLIFAGSTINNLNGQTPKKTTVETETKKYICPEHPSVVMNKPGKCPKCGMTLIEKTKMENWKTDNHKDSINTMDSLKMKDMPM